MVLFAESYIISDAQFGNKSIQQWNLFKSGKEVNCTEPSPSVRVLWSKCSLVFIYIGKIKNLMARQVRQAFLLCKTDVSFGKEFS